MTAFIHDLAREAALRHDLHVGQSSHRPLSENYELVALAGEKALADLLGLPLDLVLRPNGDGGKDFVATIFGRERIIDVKAARKPKHLLVEVGKCVPSTIYVLAKYDDFIGEAYCLAWQWGVLLLRTEPKDFGYGVLNHHLKRSVLRPMHELLAPFFREGYDKKTRRTKRGASLPSAQIEMFVLESGEAAE